MSQDNDRGPKVYECMACGAGTYEHGPCHECGADPFDKEPPSDSERNFDGESDT